MLAPPMGAQITVAEVALPDAPDPQTPSPTQRAAPQPCPHVPHTQHAVPTQPAVPGSESVTPAAPRAPAPGEGVRPVLAPCTVPKQKNWYRRFADGPSDKPLTPKDKAWLAARNLVDPFNVITIGGEAGISVASDSHSPYGPGMPGYGRYVGMSFSEDMTGEFFGTFLIPSLVHQDPHYHRMEGASIPRRAAHTVFQVFWTQGDNGRGMLNYANLVGFALDDEIANLYVPGRQTNASATAQRYVIGLATAPIGNVVSEFLPDVASHIHVQIVIIQRIINQVARNGAGGTQQ